MPCRMSAGVAAAARAAAAEQRCTARKGWLAPALFIGPHEGGASVLLAEVRVTLPHHALHLEGLVEDAANQLNKLEDDHGALLLKKQTLRFRDGAR